MSSRRSSRRRALRRSNGPRTRPASPAADSCQLGCGDDAGIVLAVCDDADPGVVVRRLDICPRCLGDLLIAANGSGLRVDLTISAGTAGTSRSAAR